MLKFSLDEFLNNLKILGNVKKNCLFLKNNLKHSSLYKNICNIEILLFNCKTNKKSQKV